MNDKQSVLKIVTPKPGEPRDKWDVLAPETILSEKEIQDLKSHMGKGPVAFDAPLEKIAPDNLKSFAKENKLALAQLARAVTANPVFNNTSIYTKGIPAPSPDSSNGTPDTASNSQDIWRAFYEKYDIPPEMQQELFEQGVAIQVNKLGNEGFRNEQGEKSTMFGSAQALSGDVDSMLPELAHEVGHWYYHNQLDDNGRNEVNQYFASHPEYSKTIKSVGEKQGYKDSGMDADKIGNEGFASSFLPGASTYGLQQSDTQRIAKDMPQYYPPNWSNKYHTYSINDMQAEWDKPNKALSRSMELDTKSIGI